MFLISVAVPIELQLFLYHTFKPTDISANSNDGFYGVLKPLNYNQ